MPDTSVEDMSRQQFSIAYDGASRRDDHTIDVQVLAPALMAVGRLIREANAEFNPKKTVAKVRVVSDFEHKCFNINFEVAISIYDHVKMLIDGDGLKSAKEVLELLGMLGVPPVGVAFLSYLKWRNGRKVAAKPIVDVDQKGLVEVHVEGDGATIQVHQHIYNLGENPTALRAARDALAPVGQDGFDSIHLRENDRVVGTISSDDVKRIAASCEAGILDSKELQPNTEISSAWLSVYSPVYDVNAPNWRFRLGKEIIYADISDTDIAQSALLRGGAMADDSYQVRLQVTVEVDVNGKEQPPAYKVLEVIHFVPAQPVARQTELFGKPDVG